jgi:hypothetical protein
MRFHYIMPILVTIPLLLSAGNTWGCITDGGLPIEEDLQYPPAYMIAFKAVITKIRSHGNLDQGKPHGGFQLNLKITNVYQGTNLGDTIIINYGGCHNLPGKQGDEINVLALHDKREGWYAPQFWKRGNKLIRKREWYQWW